MQYLCRVGAYRQPLLRKERHEDLIRNDKQPAVRDPGQNGRGAGQRRERVMRALRRISDLVDRPLFRALYLLRYQDISTK